VPCTCDALRDQVTLDMALFCPDHSAISIDTQSVSASVDGDDQSDNNDADTDAEASPMSDVSEADVVSAAGKRQRTPQPAAAAAAHKAPRTGGNTVGVIAAASRALSERVSRGTRSGPPPPRTTSTSKAAAKPLRAAAMKLSAARKQCSRNGAVMHQLAALPKPAAIVHAPLGPEDAVRRFDLVVPLDTTATCKKKVVLQYLREGRDGLYRPCSEVTEELRSSLLPIRTQVLDPGSRKPGFKLLTLRSRILGTELV
jgi:hypothetical protein